ncbi:MAG: GTP-binding protein [Methanobacteriaceae archaeon]|nr:GTP-binding protein [Methanobacteriaceae archaeon]
MISDIYNITKKGERKNIEFKKKLSRGYHLLENRKQRLAAQMKYRMEKGNGEAVYFIGVDDDGELVGLEPEKFRESIFVLKEIANEINAEFQNLEEYSVDQGKIARVLIGRKPGSNKEHVLVGVAGHVDHGKSTLLGTLTTGKLDDGSGKTRIFLDVQKHEIERGLSADLSFAIYGFIDDKTVHVENPLDKKEKSKLVEKSDRLISFVDTVGHEPWLRTTIRGIVGQKLNYGLLTIAADQGPTHITKEHLGIILAMDLPVIITLTKIDLVSSVQIKNVKEKIFEILKLVGRIPYKVETEKDAEFIAINMNQHLVPVIMVSAVTGEGLNLLNKLFLNLKSPIKEKNLEKPFMMYIDKIYSVIGVGTVVSGTIRQGKVEKGDKLILGPNNSGKFMDVTVKSIEMHHYKIGCAETGDVVGISIKGINIGDIRRGMIICDRNYDADSVKEFEAEVAILVHPTAIKKGYESVTHIETISETTIFEPLEEKYLSAGDSGKVLMRFKYRSYCIKEGQKLIFREGRSKGIGTVKRIIK